MLTLIHIFFYSLSFPVFKNYKFINESGYRYFTTFDISRIKKKPQEIYPLYTKRNSKWYVCFFLTFHILHISKSYILLFCGFNCRHFCSFYAQKKTQSLCDAFMGNSSVPFTVKYTGTLYELKYTISLVFLYIRG